jgi:hypothetical protein
MTRSVVVLGLLDADIVVRAPELRATPGTRQDKDHHCP